MTDPASTATSMAELLQARISRYRPCTSGGPKFAYEYCVQWITPEEKAGLDLMERRCRQLDVPRTTSGKVQRHLCRAGYEQGTLRPWKERGP